VGKGAVSCKRSSVVKLKRAKLPGPHMSPSRIDMFVSMPLRSIILVCYFSPIEHLWELEVRGGGG
jgi:hypothetical protein